MITNPDELNDQDKAILTAKALEELYKSLPGPDDIYKQILLEELFRLILDEPTD